MSLSVRCPDNKTYRVFDFDFSQTPCVAYVPYEDAIEYNEWRYLYLVDYPYDTTSYEGDIYTYDPTQYPKIRVRTPEGNKYVVNKYNGYHNEYSNRIEVLASCEAVNIDGDTHDRLAIKKIQMLDNLATVVAIRASIWYPGAKTPIISAVAQANSKTTYFGSTTTVADYVAAPNYGVRIDYNHDGQWEYIGGGDLDSYGSYTFYND